MKKQNKKPTENLKDFDRLLDTVLSILTKLTLAEMAVKTMIDIWNRR